MGLRARFGLGYLNELALEINSRTTLKGNAGQIRGIPIGGRRTIYVHKELGPGFLESIYEEAIATELSHQKIPYQRQCPIFIRYKEKVIGMHRLDLLIEDKIIVELKAVKDIDESHLATCLSYLKATGLDVGLIINFSRATIRIRRVVRTTGLTAEAGSAEDAEGFLKI